MDDAKLLPEALVLDPDDNDGANVEPELDVDTPEVFTVLPIWAPATGEVTLFPFLTTFPRAIASVSILSGFEGGI